MVTRIEVGTLALYDALFETLKVKVTAIEADQYGRITIVAKVTSRKSKSWPVGSETRSSIHWLRQHNGAPFDSIGAITNNNWKGYEQWLATTT